MKKIITLFFSFIIFISLSACSEKPDELYGYWKRKVGFTKSGYEVLTIAPDKIGVGKKLYDVGEISKQNDLWIFTLPEFHEQGLLVNYGVKVIDNNTIERFEIIENHSKSIGKYIRITKEEAEEIVTKPSSIRKPSVNDPF